MFRSLARAAIPLNVKNARVTSALRQARSASAPRHPSATDPAGFARKRGNSTAGGLFSIMINILVLVASLSQPVDIPTIMVTPQEQETQRQQAIGFMDEYFQHFSNPDVLTLFQRDYAGYIDYYGKVTDKNDVMSDKARVVKRWPQRTYHPHQMQSSCVTVRGDVVCSVTGLVDFECGSPDRHAHSKGVARFTAHIWYGGSNPLIIGERSMVVG